MYSILEPDSRSVLLVFLRGHSFQGREQIVNSRLAGKSCLFGNLCKIFGLFEFVLQIVDSQVLQKSLRTYPGPLRENSLKMERRKVNLLSNFVQFWLMLKILF